ncbi:TPA: DUF4179 domain-containing protein [Clostridioides difficile]
MKKLDNIKMPDNFDLAIQTSISKALNEKKKMNRRKSITVTLISFFILGLIALNSETTWAYIRDTTKQIESFFGREKNIFDKYKFEGEQIIESNGLKFSLGEVILDDRQLIVSMSADYTDFKIKFKNIGKVGISPSFPTIYIDDLVFPGQSYSTITEKVKGEKKYNILLKVSLLQIDTNKDGIADTEYEILNKINSNKNYSLKISFTDIDYGIKNGIENNVGNWKFNTTINASNIIKDTKIYEVDKEIKIDEKEYKGTLNIKEVRVSPISIKVKYNYDSYTEIGPAKRSDPYLIIKDENGKKLNNGTGAGGILQNKKNYINGEFELRGSEKKITIIPCIYVNDKEKCLFNKTVNLNID